jgi:transcriptional regulator with XRE-family HTH domain
LRYISFAAEITAFIFMHSPDLASLISFHRKQAGLSQVELALHAEVSRNVVQDLEAGKERASWRNLQAVLGVLNIRLEPAGPLVEAWKSQSNKKEDTGS